MTDRELLELAAKAAGIDYVKPADGYDGSHGLVLTDSVGRHLQSWNPLTDDGDALRLAVKLGIDPKPRKFGADAVCLAEGVSVRDLGDEYEATRRAIVRAAAEIGKGMK